MSRRGIICVVFVPVLLLGSLTQVSLAQPVGPPPPPILCIDEDVPIQAGGFASMFSRLTSFFLVQGDAAVNAFTLSIAFDDDLFLLGVNTNGTLLKSLTLELFVVDLDPPGAGGFRIHDAGPLSDPISDALPPVVSDLIIPESAIIGDLNVGVDVAHMASADLTIDLISPSATVVTLHNMSGAADYMATLYDDEGTVPPDGPGALADFIGEDKAGIWTLTITDMVPGNDGSLNGWFLDVLQLGPQGFTVSAILDSSGPPFDGGIPVGGVQDEIVNMDFGLSSPVAPGAVFPVVFDDTLDPLIPNSVSIDDFVFTVANGLELDDGNFVELSGDFIRGDCNDQRGVDIADGIFLINFLFGAGTVEPICPAACDFNGDGMLTIEDPIQLINYVLQDGPPPVPPFPDCGPPLPTDLPCDGALGCP